MNKKRQLYFNIITITIGIVAIFVAVYLYLISIKKSEPTYYVHPGRVKIIDMESQIPSELEVLYNSKPIGQKCVTAVRLYFWNAGRLPIKKEDILEPLLFKLPETTEILESRILKQSRENIVKFEIVPIAKTQKNILPVNFNIMEQNDGVSLQVIYAGKPDAAITMKGIIMGYAKPIQLDSSKTEKYYKRPTTRESIQLGKKVYCCAFGVGFFVFLSCLALWNRYRKSKITNKRKRAKPMLYMGIIFLIIYSSIAFWVYYDTKRTFSPRVPSSIWLED